MFSGTTPFAPSENFSLSVGEANLDLDLRDNLSSSWEGPAILQEQNFRPEALQLFRAKRSQTSQYGCDPRQAWICIHLPELLS